MIKPIVSLLPESIRDVLRPLYKKLTRAEKVRIDKRLLQYLVDFYNINNEYKLTLDDAVCLCKLGKRLMADWWSVIDPISDEEVRKFYQTCPYSLFELIYAHGNLGFRSFRDEVAEIAEGDVLDYGGGDGSLSMRLREKGLRVTYVDIPSISKDFASWVFRKRGMDIDVLDALEDSEIIWGRQYDTVLSIEVIEHVTNPTDLLEKLANSLRNRGKLIITRLSCPGPTAEWPMHFRLPIDGEAFLSSCGLVKEENAFDGDRSLWVKK
jgi:2-polyprenyl-3-methyl-5-hydroxy-6-metoxy-1,4-benzoquinol methylase